MKKILLTILFITCLILVVCNNKKNNSFLLEEKYYGTANFIEMDNKKLNSLIKEKESFVIFIYQPLCTTSYEFNKVLTEFLDNYQMSFYKIAFSDIKDTSLGNYVKYYPSLVIYQNGEIVDYLEADKDEDLEYYKNVKGFEEWFKKYVTIKKRNNNQTKEENTNVNNKIDTVLNNVKYDENKINIYFFWGDGCPHCEEEFKFLKSIETEFGDYYNLHTFEVWYNEKNADLLTKFASKMGDEVTGVPYTIIGKKTFIGFSENYEKEFLEAIRTQYKDSYDVYFDS